MSQKTLMIAFGSKAKSGKDTAAKRIMETFGDRYQFAKVAFGDALKCEIYDALNNWRDPIWDQVKSLFNYLSLPHPTDVLLHPPISEKIAWVDANKTNPDLVRLLQWWGTEYRRGQSPFYWVQRLRERLEQEKPQIALITDLRFKSEFYFVSSFGGYTVRINRHGFVLNDGRSTTHQSEVDLDGIKFHFEIDVLDGEVEQLKKDACCVFELIVAAQNPIKEDDTDAVEQEETVVAG
jgi:hypothetical protein